LIVESILRGILFAADERQCSSFDTIYVQLDKCSTNKCATVIVACALLVKLGICRKVKVNFLEVGHTHEDIDALIGSVVTKLRIADLSTFDERVEAIKNALNHMETGQVKDVQEVIGMTDYESGLDGIFPKVTGMKEIKEFRVSANVDGEIIFLYKSNSTIDGWLPKPFEKTEDFEEMGKIFKHPDPNQGAPVHCNRYPGSSAPDAERGKRQHWFYEIRYAGGAVKTWALKCSGIKIEFPHNISSITTDLRPQAFSDNEESLSKEKRRNHILENIRSILIARSGKYHIYFFLTAMTNLDYL
jgi:hypothetical protein